MNGVIFPSGEIIDGHTRNHRLKVDGCCAGVEPERSTIILEITDWEADGCCPANSVIIRNSVPLEITGEKAGGCGEGDVKHRKINGLWAYLRGRACLTCAIRDFSVFEVCNVLTANVHESVPNKTGEYTALAD